jgi:hypothetical protein
MDLTVMAANLERASVSCVKATEVDVHAPTDLMLANNSLHAYACTIDSVSMRPSMTEKDPNKVAGGKARSEKLTAAQRSEIAKKAALARHNKGAPQATHESHITLGDLKIECAVLDDGRRVISERAMTKAFGGRRGGSHWKRIKEGGANLPVYLSATNFLPFIDSGLGDALTSPILYKTKNGNIANGLEASLLPKVCNVFLKARDADSLHKAQIPMSAQADIIMRGLAEVGIVALIDEATGYQRERANDALSRILEAFVAKELQPWVKTFPDDFYAQLFRLRGLTYPAENVKRPQYFGHLTNDIIYKRLAPAVLDELKSTTPKTPKGRLKSHYHRHLTTDLGHPKLREHLASVVTAMKLSKDYNDFRVKLDLIHPRYDETMVMDFMADEPEDNGVGL